MQISELKLAKDLIRKPSITPKDAGAINLLAKNLRSIGFNCKIINFKNIKKVRRNYFYLVVNQEQLLNKQELFHNESRQ